MAETFDSWLPMLEGEPEIFRVLRLLWVLGIPPAGVHLEFPLLPRDLHEVEALGNLSLGGRGPLVAVHPGARSPARRWRGDRFATVAALLRSRRDARIVLVGGPDEAGLAEAVIGRAGVEALNLAGKLTLGGLGAMLTRVDLFVGNDSGPAQMASALSPRSLRIFGPADRHRWAPLDRVNHRIVYRGVECSPCGHWECPIGHLCLEGVAVQDVMAQVDALLEDRSSQREMTGSPQPAQS